MGIFLPVGGFGSLSVHNVLVVINGVTAIIRVTVLDTQISQELIVGVVSITNLQIFKLEWEFQYEIFKYLVHFDLAIGDHEGDITMFFLALDFVVDDFALSI